MSILQELLIKIGVSINQSQLAAVDAGMAKVGASAAVLDREVTAAAAAVNTSLVPALKSMLLPLAGITAAIGYAYKETFEFIEKSAEGFEQIAHLANRVNTSAEAIKKLGYIAEFTGSSMEAAQASLDGLNKAAGSTALGVGRAKVVFKAIGVSVTDSNGKLKDTTKLLFEVGEHIKGMERGKQLAVLSRLGIDPTLINSLTTDVSKLAKEYDAVMKGAGINNNEAAESAVRFAEASKRVGNIWGAIKDAVAASFFDKFADGFDSFSDLLIENMPVIIGLLKPIITSMIQIAGIALQIGAVFGGMATKVISFLGDINKATGGWALRIAAVIFAWKKLNFAFLMSPIGIILELATAFSLLYDDYKTWEKGGKSFIDWGNTSGQIIKDVAIAVGALATAFYAANTALKLASASMEIFDIILSANPIGLVIALIAGLTAAGYEMYKHWDVISAQFHKIFGSLANWFESTWQGVYDWFAGIFSKIIGTIDKVAAKTENLFGGGKNALAPSPATAGAIASGKNVTVNNNTAINVHGSGNPYETATAVKNQQKSVNANHVRNVQGAVR
jgi:hypothetical protein